MRGRLIIARAVLPERLPLFLRISAADWTVGGWTIEDSVTLANQAKQRGVDLVDFYSRGSVPRNRSGESRFSSAVCGQHQERSANAHRCGRHDH